VTVGSFILGGVGAKSTVALFINEGFGFVVATPAAAVAVGGMPSKRHKGKYEVVVDGVRFRSRSIEALQAKVSAWRRAHIPANDTQPQPAKEVVPREHAKPVETAPPAILTPAPGAAPFPLAPPHHVIFPPPAPLPPSEVAAAAAGILHRHEQAMAFRAHAEAAEREVAALHLAAIQAAHAAAAHQRHAEEDDLQALMAILEAA
jgi:hypothetical protein